MASWERQPNKPVLYETVATLSKIISSAFAVNLFSRLRKPLHKHLTTLGFPGQTRPAFRPWPAWMQNGLITSHKPFSKNPKFLV